MIECSCGNTIDKVVQCGSCDRLIECTTDQDETKFFQAVRELRLAQKQFFKTKRGDDLVEAKRIEKLVDKMIATKAGGQKELF